MRWAWLSGWASRRRSAPWLPMAQAGHSEPADSFAPGDIKTARMFGANVAEALLRMACSVPLEVTP